MAPLLLQLLLGCVGGGWTAVETLMLQHTHTQPHWLAGTAEPRRVGRFKWLIKHIIMCFGVCLVTHHGVLLMEKTNVWCVDVGRY